MMHLVQTATHNGLITEQEVMLLNEFNSTLTYYGNELDRILAKGKVTNDDETYLNDLKETIIDNGFEVANEINGVSTDLMNLIVTVIISLRVPKPNDFI